MGLARRFGATDGHKFVNGVLDRAARLWRARSIERRALSAEACVAVSESQLIERYFRDLGARRDDVALGIGDDAALLQRARAAESWC